MHRPRLRWMNEILSGRGGMAVAADVMCVAADVMCVAAGRYVCCGGGDACRRQEHCGADVCRKACGDPVRDAI